MENKKALIIVILLALVSVISYFALNYTSQSKKSFENPTLEETEEKKIQEKEKSEDKQEETKVNQNEKSKENKKDFTFLMLGVDEGERSDTIIVCKYFGETGKISALSIPRDTRTEIQGYGQDKINHAHAYKGPELSLQAVNNLLNMDIKHYVRVDYDLVKEVVNTIGGIDMYIPEDTHFWKKGNHHFDGEDAVNFVRYRAGYSNQDLGRISTQQEFLKQVLVKMKDNQNILEFTKMIKSGIDNINTNIPLNKILSYALILKNTEQDKLEMKTLPGVPKMINKVSYIIVDREEIPKIVEELFYNNEIK